MTRRRTRCSPWPVWPLPLDGQAAGGTPPQEEPIFTLLRGGAEDGQREAASQPEIG